MTLAYWCVVLAMFLPWLCAYYSKKVGGFSGNDNQSGIQLRAIDGIGRQCGDLACGHVLNLAFSNSLGTACPGM